MRKPRSVLGAAASLRGRWQWFAGIGLPLVILCASAAAPAAGATEVGAGAAPLKLQTTWTVTKTADTNDGTCDSDCSLREAIAAAAASGDIIIFDGSLSGATITLALNVLAISKSVDIDASALSSPIAISGADTYQVFNINAGHTVQMTNLTIRDGTAGSGGGISNSGSLTLERCTVADNASGLGGGIVSLGSSSLSLTEVTFSGNTASNSGGALVVYGTAVVDACTFTDNQATSFGGAIFLQGTSVGVTNSTFTANTAGAAGGAIRVQTGSLDLTSSTVAGNGAGSGGGVSNNLGTLTAGNSIVANNTGANCSGTITNGGNNIDSGTSCGWGSTNGSVSDTDPLLTALGDFGGPTLTMALRSGSPAINGVTYNAPNGSPGTDQRGLSRPQQGTLHDIGAYERAANGAVQLVRFEAHRFGRAVVLGWETAGEIKHAGFRVLREEPDGRLTDLTPRLIRPASPGGELGGATYRFTDHAAPWVATRYWLEDVDTLGNAARHGPADAPVYLVPPSSLPLLLGARGGQVGPLAPQTEEVLP